MKQLSMALVALAVTAALPAHALAAQEQCQLVLVDGVVVEEICTTVEETVATTTSVERTVEAPRETRLRRWGFFIGGGPAVGTAFTHEAGLHYGGTLGIAVGLGSMRLDGRLTITGRPGDGMRVAADTGVAFLVYDGRIGPYVGAGVGIEHQNVKFYDPMLSREVDAETTGFAGYVSAGVELLRDTTHRLLVEARTTLPAFETGHGPSERWVPSVQGAIMFLW